MIRHAQKVLSLMPRFRRAQGQDGKIGFAGPWCASARCGDRGSSLVKGYRPSVLITQVTESEDGKVCRMDDYLAVNEPLEMRASRQSLGITLRTPGHDLELAAGFLHQGHYESARTTGIV
jgi:hypothetical protein